MTGAHPLNWTHVLRTGRISPEQEAIVDYWDMRASSIELRSQIVAFVRDFGPKTLPWNDRAYNPVRSLFEKYTLEDFDLMVKSTSRLHSANPAAEQLVLRVPGVVLGEGRAEAHHLVNEVHSTLCPPANDKEPLFSPIYRQYRQEFEAPAFNTNSDAFMAKFTTQGVVSDGSPVGEAPFRYVMSTELIHRSAWTAVDPYSLSQMGLWKVEDLEPSNVSNAEQILVEFGPRLGVYNAHTVRPRRGL